MTKEQAIEFLQIKSCVNCSYGAISPRDCLVLECELKSAINMAIKALERQPSEDCVSRADLDKALYERFHEEDSPNNITDVKLGSVRNFVRNFPPITPTQSWIPVSERLPENHDDVLVWFEYIKDDCDCAWWGLAYYSLQYKKWVVSTNERNPIVKAW